MTTPSIKVKVIGAGSIGNHLAHASRRAGWEVVITDTDEEALNRMKNDIYSTRYGKWDEGITQYTADKEPKGKFDVVFIGTPPDSHLKIATRIINEEAPGVLQIEKPLCSPSLDGIEDFLKAVKAHPETKVVVGFNHVLTDSMLQVEKWISEKKLGKLRTLDANTRANWDGILKAHPWLSGPEDTYLGYWERGGGAGGEHSHGINFWQHLAHVAGAGRVESVQASIEYKKEGKAEFDTICFITMVTESGIVGRLAQDVVTLPADVTATLQFERGHIDWGVAGPGLFRSTLYDEAGVEVEKIDFPTSPADSYFGEINHIKGILEGDINIEDSPIRLERGLDTMLVLKVAHEHASKKASHAPVPQML